MNVRFGAMAFVVATRLLLLVAGLVVALPFAFVRKHLPTSKGIKFERLARIRKRISQWTIDHLPPWLEHYKGGMFMVKTDRGMDRLDALVERSPDWIIERWSQFGVAIMSVFVVVWAGILLLWLAAAAWSAGLLSIAVVKWATAFDWLSLFQPRPVPEYDLFTALLEYIGLILEFIELIPWLIVTLASLAVAFVVSIAFWWGIMLPLLPGLVLHEFGHYAALRKAGASVDSYGLLLFGPYLGGAFVDPGDDASLLNWPDTYAVWSAGIANSLIWGTALIITGIVMGAQPVALFTAILNLGLVEALLANPVPSFLVLLGGIEVGNGFLNAVPMGPVDGGGFIRSVEEEWWARQSPFHFVADVGDGGDADGS